MMTTTMTTWESKLVNIWPRADDADRWRDTSWYLLGMSHAFGQSGMQEQRDDAQFLSSLAMELSAP